MRRTYLCLLLCLLPLIARATPLIEAVESGDRDRVMEVLAEDGADPDEADKDGTTPLQAAAYGNFPKIAIALLDAGADVDLPGEYNDTPLGTAAENGNTETLIVLLDRKATIDKPCGDGGSTPLHMAAGNGEIGALDVLIDHDANLEARDKKGETPLMWAAHGSWKGEDAERLVTASHLIYAGAEIDATSQSGDTALMAAVGAGNLGIVKLLLSREAVMDLQNNQGTNALMLAAERADLEILRLLLDEQASVQVRDADGCTAALRAAKSDNPAALEVLLDAGDAVSYPDDPTQDLRIAAMLGDEAKVRACLAAKADLEALDLQGKTALVSAILRGQVTVARLLLDAGARVTEAEDAGIGPLDAAATRGSTELLTLILDRLPVEGRQGVLDRALLASAEEGQVEAARLLLDRGASAQPEENPLPLLKAARAGSLELVTLLLDHGAKVDATEYDGGDTALVIAARHGFTDIVKLLLDRGADTSLRKVEWALHDDACTPQIRELLGPPQAARHLAEARKLIEAATTEDDLKQALGELERAVELAPDLPQTNYNLGLIQEQLGETEGARAHFMTALKLDPEGPLAKDLRKHLAALPGAPAPSEEEGQTPAGPAATTGTTAAEGREVALLVGVNNYAADLGPLDFASNDVRDLAGVLTDPANEARLSSEAICLLTDDQTEEALRPSAANLMKVLVQARKAYSQEPIARVLFVFVGRTFSVDGETYLLMPEVQASDLADEDLARELVPRKSVALSSVRKYLQQTGAREVVLIVNSCGNRSGATITQTTTTSTGGTQTPGGVTTILASLTGDSSFEVEGKRRGLFGWTLSRELRGVADLDRNGAVTLQELTTKLSNDLSGEATQRGLTLGQSVTVTTEGTLSPDRLLLTAFPAGK